MIRRALANPHLWFFATLVWAIALFVLSSLSKVGPDNGPQIPHMDKMVHFIYFMSGAFTFTMALLMRQGSGSRSILQVLLPILLFAFIGALDEWHQSFTPGRTGNDPFDWLADVLGATAGSLIAPRFKFLASKSLF